ncbi:MAG: phosphatidylglycerol lysyltransferase domain-containing protein [Candidatus Aureabacteria bacterium]|nr:phosphatidylglycerol lysyltransferase domain-containing protein [Candidatus Auribacterota bacterium]
MSKCMGDFFSEIRIRDREIIAPLLTSSNLMASDYTFPNLYMWGEIYGLGWKVCEGLLLIYSKKDDVFLMPAGRPFLPDELFEISDSSVRRGLSGNFVLIEGAYLEQNVRIAERFDVAIDPDNSDYVYSAEALCELKGNKLHKKKNLVSQFLRNNPGHRCEEMEQRHFKECFTLAEKWCEDRNCEKLGFTHESSALKRGLNNFRELGLRGLVIFARDRLIAFSIFSAQNKNTTDVHFEKYDPGIKGAAQAINWETARHLRGACEYLNREQDLGIAGLRRAKQSYCPEFRVITYALRRKER